MLASCTPPCTPPAQASGEVIAPISAVLSAPAVFLSVTPEVYSSSPCAMSRFAGNAHPGKTAVNDAAAGDEEGEATDASGSREAVQAE